MTSEHSTETDAWQAAALSSLLRDAMILHGGESQGALSISEDQKDALMVGLYRLAELTRRVATTTP